MKKLSIFAAVIACSLIPFLRASAQTNNANQEYDPALDSSASPTPVQQSETQYAPDEFMKAQVREITKDDYITLGGYKQPYQQFTATILEGSDKGKTISLDYGAGATLQEDQRLKVGEVIVVGKVQDANGTTYYIQDSYRAPSVAWMFAIFVVVIIVLGRKRGFTSLLGLLFTIGILGYVLIPQIVAGRNPLMVIIIGAFVIAVVSLYLAHGFNRQTTIAVISTLVTLSLSIAFSSIAVWWARLSGQGTEEAFLVQVGTLQHVSLRGLFLAGIIIGTLGVLDDITTAQSAVVYELKHANPKFGLKDLYRRSINVGREHIASLVNTLVLAYAGASFPLLLLFSMENHMPWWVVVNGENIMEEVVRTLTGSMTLVLAVPITTLFAAWYWGQRKVTDYAGEAHHHH